MNELRADHADVARSRLHQVTKGPHRRTAGIFATLDSGAPKTLGLYFMYDVKQVDPASGPLRPGTPRSFDKPGLGKVVIGRGAVNQKGPKPRSSPRCTPFVRRPKAPRQSRLRSRRRREIGSPHFHQVVHRPDVLAAVKNAAIFMPSSSQGLDGEVTVTLAPKV